MNISDQISFLLLTIVFLLVGGTFIFHALEGWNYIDSFYFSTITLTTIGYGDIKPTKPVTKILTSFYALYGVGAMLYVLTLFITDLLKKQQNRFYYYMRKLKEKGSRISFRRKKKSKKKK